MSIGVLLIALVGLGAWKLNVRTAAYSPVPGVTQEQANEGQDKTLVPRQVVDQYSVAPDLPRTIFIDKLGIAARIFPMGINPDKSMQAPSNIHDAGWYTGSAKPGEDGAMVIDGHTSRYSANNALFSSLDTLSNGDTITIESGNGLKHTYRVAHTEVTPVDAADMHKALSTYGNASQGLTLIACTGKWVKARATFDHRIFVFAVLISAG